MVEIKTCPRCILTSQIPNILFDNNGVCNYEKKQYLDRDYVALEKKMISTLRVSKKHPYDCMALYSGGKDSTYMLYRLANHYKLRVLAFHPPSIIILSHQKLTPTSTGFLKKLIWIDENQEKSK